jgi:CRISPR-associated endonuclease/helicase Cas3
MIDARLFWGKARGVDGGGPLFHPLVFHGLDVAACFERIILSRLQTVDLLEHAFAAELKAILPGLTALVALHDIGKVLAAFQMKVPDLCPPVLRSSSLAGKSYNHAEGGLNLLLHPLRDVLRPIVRNLAPDERMPLFWAIAHHHGRPLSVDASNILISPLENALVQQVAQATLAAFDGVDLTLPQIDEVLANRFSWPLSGLITLADWLGSSDHFPYVAAEQYSAQAYWQAVAQPQAGAAVSAAGLAPAGIRQSMGGHALFGETFRARPAQSIAEGVALGSGPQLFILEEMTGAGKTEAALLLAHRLMAAGRASGLFIALPTTATADAMYQRMAKAYGRLFAEGALPSLALAHGRRYLNDGFRASLFTAGEVAGLAAEEDENRVACNAFFADDRRKTFLSDVGVGTIDQALMAVLPTKFATLRQFGLADKVLVIDEAHAYDAYMSKEVERLLAFHAAAGGSAILLSATLPQKTRDAYACSFRGGSGRNPPVLTEMAYPLLTRIPAALTEVIAEIPVMPTPRQAVGVKRLDTSVDALELIVEAARAGAAVAYIRNAVDDAREIAEALRARGLEPILFHARFAMGDRLSIEKTVLATFGKESGRAQRIGKVLVATQVVEQSLDLDFDVMISDLAPVDLLIQRAGRLWRHVRQERPAEAPVLHVVSPEPDEIAGRDWLKPTLTRTSFVYKAHGILWLTAKTLFEKGQIDSPVGMRALIEAVYAPNLAGEDAYLLPEGLHDAEIREAGNKSAQRSFANQNLLNLGSGYCLDNRPWQSDTVTPTRLGEAQRAFRLATWEDGRLRPWAAGTADAGSDIVRQWALSEVSLRISQASGRLDLLPPLRQAVAAIEAQWQSLSGDGTLILPLEWNGEHWSGLLTRERDGKPEPVPVRYSKETGLALG